MLESLESALAAGRSKQLDDARGQIGLFGDEEIQDSGYKIPDIPERPKKEILAWEKNILGFYISGHPLDEFSEKIFNLTKLKDISEGKILSGKRVKVGGIITESRRLTTKKGDMMAFATLEDFSGSLKITIFPAVFNRYMNLIVPDEIVIIGGKVELGDEKQILADKIISAQNYLPDFYLTVPDELENSSTYDELKKIFSENRGDCEVYLKKRGKWQKLGNDKKISYDKKICEQLKNLLGEENVKIY